jgi:hypothetical protein
MRFRVLALAALLAVGACSNSVADPPAADSVAVQLGREFELKMNQTGTVDGVRLTLRGVPEDSRCPIDVVCVWEGNARAVLEVRAGANGEPTTINLNTSLAPQEATVLGLRVRLNGVLPAPRSSEPIRPDGYSVLLVIQR